MNSDKWQSFDINTTEWFNTLLKDFSHLFYNTNLQQFVSRTVESINNVLNCESSPDCVAERLRISREMIEENLKSLGVIDNNVSNDIMTDQQRTINTDFDKLKNVLNLITINQKSLLIDLKTTSISTALVYYYAKEIEENSSTRTTWLFVRLQPNLSKRKELAVVLLATLN